jgi:protein-S-isoprenylcysteine O-methyltransferase Ste14
VIRLGGWLFRQRSWLPAPLILALVLIPGQTRFSAPACWTIGAALVAAGEALRLWGVLHIGVISRTRSDRLGPLVSTGPFAIVRNPLYVGNVLLWAGFAVSARLLWLAPIAVALLGFEYHAIVRWEEQLLHERLGPAYQAYALRVPRWIPSLSSRSGSSAAAVVDRTGFSLGDTLFSERGTLIAIAVGYLLLYLKGRF